MEGITRIEPMNNDDIGKQRLIMENALNDLERLCGLLKTPNLSEESIHDLNEAIQNVLFWSFTPVIKLCENVSNQEIIGFRSSRK